MEAPKASLSAAQLRAARGLLDWTRSDLAKACGLSAETIKNIERGVYMPQETTINAIMSAFAGHNIEFTDQDGIRRSTGIVVTFEGIADFRRYSDSVYKYLHEHQTDRCIYVFGNRDKEFFEALGDYAPAHLQRMSKLEKLHFKALILKESEAMVSEYIEYRYLPDFPFAIPFSTYGECLDFIIYGEGPYYPKVVTIKSAPIANAYKAQFEALWEMSDKAKVKDK